MGAHTSKMRCLYLPAQSGKTRKVEDDIRLFKNLSVLYDKPTDINIIISANNKLLVHQTTSRLKSNLCSSSDEDEEEESNAVITGNIFSWTSGTKKTNISVKELAYEILTDSVEMVIICAHSKRMDYVAELTNLLARSRNFNKKVNFWVDEADRSIKLWSKTKFEVILALPLVRQLTLVSATHDSIFEKYTRLEVIPFQETFPACYRRLSDSTEKVCDYPCGEAADYIEHVIKKIPTEALIGKRFFTPGNFTRESHDKVADVLGKLGFVVIIINGMRKELVIPGIPPIDLRPFFKVSNPDEIPPEFNQTLARIYKERELSQYPFAITGFLCVERGITFQCGPEDDHDGFLFDAAVIPPISDAAEAYQTMARVFGNVGHYPGYKPCRIWSTSANFEMIHHQEEVAVNIARIVSQYKLRDVGKEELAWAAKEGGCECSYCQKIESRASANEADFDHEYREFTTLDAANKYYTEDGSKPKNEDEFYRDETDTRFYTCSTTSKLTRHSYDKLLRLCHGKKTANLPAKDLKLDKTVQRFYIGYKDLEDPTSIVFFVRRLKRTKDSNAVAPWIGAVKSGNPFD